MSSIVRKWFRKMRDRRTLKRAAKIRRMSNAQLRANTRRRSKRYDKYR